MITINGYRSSRSFLFGLVDGLLILIGVVAGTYLRFSGHSHSIFVVNHFVLKVMLIALVNQVVFYYFDLYDSKTFRERKKTALLLLGSLGVASIFLAVIYYLVPFLTLGRGIFAISLFFIFIFTFSWRVLCSYSLKALVSKEKILIIGTGELAKKVKSEILENGYEGFEIVGFIDESRDKIGHRV